MCSLTDSEGRHRPWGTGPDGRVRVLRVAGTQNEDPTSGTRHRQGPHGAGGVVGFTSDRLHSARAGGHRSHTDAGLGRRVPPPALGTGP